MSQFFKQLVFSLFPLLGLLCAADASGQRVQFVDPFQSQNGNLGNGGAIAQPQNLPQLPRLPQLPQLAVPIFPNPANPNFDPRALQTGFPVQGNIAGPFQVPLGQNLPAVPNLDLQNSLPLFPTRDPSAFQSQPFPVFPNANLNTQGLQVRPPPAIGFGGGTPNGFNAPNGFNQPLAASGIGQLQPNFGNGGFNNRFPSQGTGRNFLPTIDFSYPREQFQRFQNEFLPRVLERPRVRHTFLPGSNSGPGTGNELDINDIEFATTLTVPNFLQSQQPLRVSPGFIGSFWDGPDTPSTGFDLPSKAFGAYLAFDHVTDLSKTAGLETNFTVGVYSDYDNFSSDAIRLTGRILGWRRLNEYTVGKLGVEYLDRVRVKLLPAFGLFLSPNPDIKFDLFFPRSKLSHRIPNIGNFELWAYTGGEYGGGSWAIERIDGSDDRVDINDVRATVGIEWIGPRRATGFIEVGYAFERELVFQSSTNNDLDLQDTFVISTGFAF